MSKVYVTEEKPLAYIETDELPHEVYVEAMTIGLKQMYKDGRFEERPNDKPDHVKLEPKA